MTTTGGLLRTLGLCACALPIFFFTGCDDDETSPTESTVEPFVYYVRDYEYVERRIFDLGAAEDFQPGDSIEKLFLYQEIPSDPQDRPADAVYGNLYVDPDHPEQHVTENQLLSSGADGVSPVPFDEYAVYSLPDSNRHYIVFDQPQRDFSLGFWMVVHRAAGAIDTIGSEEGHGTPEDPKILKLLYASDPHPSYRTWDYMWRNTYIIRRGLSIEDFYLKVMRGLSGTEGTAVSIDYQTDSDGYIQRYIEVLGLDQNGQDGHPGHDGLIDDREAVFRPDWGLLIFPSREPFADTVTTFLGGSTQPLLNPAPGIYHYESLHQRSAGSEYFLQFYLYPK